MMYARDLRIGNYLTRNGQTFTVVLIDVTETSSITQCKPMPLTEEWLMSFKFKKQLDGFYRINNSLMIEICFLDSGILVTTQSICLSHILYVHQLQNLYHSLTGQELEMK